MNILIFDPSPSHCPSAVSALKSYRGSNQIVTAQRVESVVGFEVSDALFHYDLALFRIPNIRFLGSGEIQPKSFRAALALQLVEAAGRAKIRHAIFTTPFPTAFYAIKTDEIVPPEQAFYRRINWDTGIFEGCYIAPNWRWLVDKLKEATALETYLDFKPFLK